MEQKKVLWILFAVAALLLVVVGAGLIWFLPEEGADSVALERNAEERESAAGFDPIEWVRNEEEAPALEPKPKETEEGFIVSEELVYGTDGTPASGSEEKASEEEAERVVRLVDPAPGSRPPVQQAEPRREAPSVREPAPEPQKRLVTEYWIQAGSYGSNSRANQVREQLSEKGITSTVQTRELESGTYFRVRIGPYENSEEAAKFLQWVKNLEGFNDSYITEVYVRK